MKSKVKKINGVTREIEIALSADKVSNVVSEVLEDIRKDTVMPGFRKGKAPLDLVQKKYKDDALDEAKRRLVPKAYHDALKEHDITPVSYPVFSDMIMNGDGSLSFKAAFDIKPDFKVGRYKGMKLSGKKVSVTDEDVEEALSSVRNMNADFEKVERAIQKGDFSICDVQTFIDGEPVSNKRENMWIEADKDKSMLGLGEELCGLKAGDTKTVETSLPEKYPDEKYAGKKANFTIEIKEVKEKKLPEMDDELAKKAGKDNLADLKDDLRSRLLEGKEQNNRAELKKQVVQNLLKKNSFDVPESMVKRQLEVLVEKAEGEMARKGVTKDAIEANRENLRESLKGEAKDKIKTYFILDEIARTEDIQVTENEVEDWMKGLSQYYNQKFEDVKKYYEEHDLIDGVKEQLSEEKTLDFILSEAEISVK